MKIYDAMYRFTYRDGKGGTFTTVCSFASDKSEEDLKLQVDGHCNRYGVIGMDLVEPQDLEFEDLADD